jgi:hypothetical protein
MVAGEKCMSKDEMAGERDERVNKQEQNEWTDQLCRRIDCGLNECDFGGKNYFVREIQRYIGRESTPRSAWKRLRACSTPSYGETREYENV